MSVLYICNSSITQDLHRSLQRMTVDDALLLIENAVVALNSGHYAEPMLIDSGSEKTIFALKPDLKARGIQLSKQLSSIQQIDYSGFVKLAVDYDVTCYWK